MTKTCTICAVSGERVDNRERAELFEALLRECLWWMGMSLDNPPGLLPRIERAVSASPDELAAMRREMAAGVQQLALFEESDA